MAWKSVTTIRLTTEVLRRRKEGDQLYGLVVDEQNIVLRTCDNFKFQSTNCIFLPWSHIKRYYEAAEFDEGAGTNRTRVLRALYIDQDGKEQVVNLATRNLLERKPHQLVDVMAAWEKEIVGEWRMSVAETVGTDSDTVFHFLENDVGAMVGYYEGEVQTQYPFHWRRKGRRKIYIEPTKTDDRFPLILSGWPKENPIGAGNYDFEINVDYRNGTKFYHLRFEQKIAGVLQYFLGQPFGDREPLVRQKKMAVAMTGQLSNDHFPRRLHHVS